MRGSICANWRSGSMTMMLIVAVPGWFTLLQRHTKDTAMADARRVEGQALTLEQAMAQALEVAG